MRGDGLTVGVDTAVAAGTHALEVATRLLRAAVAVGVALVPAACQRAALHATINKTITIYVGSFASGLQQPCCSGNFPLYVDNELVGTPVQDLRLFVKLLSARRRKYAYEITIPLRRRISFGRTSLAEGLCLKSALSCIVLSRLHQAAPGCSVFISLLVN